MTEPVQDLLKLLKKEEIATLLINASVTDPGLEQTIRELAMEKKQHKREEEQEKKQRKSEEEQEEIEYAFDPYRRQNNSTNNRFYKPLFGSSQTDSSISGGTSTAVSGSSGFGQKPLSGDIPTSDQEQLELAFRQAQLKNQRANFGPKSIPPFRRVDYAVPQPITPSILISHPAFIEEDARRQTAKFFVSRSGFTDFYYERYESCFAIAGADYCVIAADFNPGQLKFSKLSSKCVMASCGFQDDVKALQEALSSENLRYEREHNKPMSCPEMRRLFCEFQKCHYKYVFSVLGGLDSKGKGCFFLHYGITPRIGHLRSNMTVPPIHKYKLPPEDDLARLSEEEAFKLARDVFKSATNTGDKLEIAVINARGVRRDEMDLMDLKASESSLVGICQTQDRYIGVQ